jgi:hypothetical protein
MIGTHNDGGVSGDDCTEAEALMILTPNRRAFSLDFPWLGKCCVLSLLDLYIYFGFPLARLKWRILLKSVRLPLQ